MKFNLFKKIALIAIIACGLMAFVTFTAVKQFSSARLETILALEKARLERDAQEAIIEELPGQFSMSKKTMLIIYSASVPMTQRLTLTVDAQGEKEKGTLDAWPQSVPMASGKYNVSGDDLGLPQGDYIAQVVEMNLPSFDDKALQSRVTERVMENYGEDFAADYAQQIVEFFTLIVRVFLWVLIGLIAAYFILGRSFKRRLSFIEDKLGAFAKGDYKTRLPKTYTKKSDELGRLSQRVNATLDKTERLISGLDNMSAQISHELKDELESLKASLSHISDPAVSLQVDGRVDGMKHLVDEVLDLVRLETDVDVPAESFYLSDPILQSIELFSDSFEDADITLEINNIEAGKGVKTSGRETLIQRMIANLLTNILRYAADGKIAKIRLDIKNDLAMLQVQDYGPGVASTHIDTLAKQGRHRADAQGYGAGLKFVRAVALRHGAKLSLENTKPGLLVTLKFPIQE